MADADMLHFALDRHGVGPRQIPDWALETLPPELRSEVNRRKIAIVRKRLLESYHLTKLGARFGDLKIPWAILKGAPLMQQLYGDAATRGSNDIDLLVRPDQFVEAVGVLEDEGWSHAQSPLRKGLSRLALRRLRDIELVARHPLPLRIELHQRPLFAEPFGRTGAGLLAQLDHTPLPTPRFGPLLVWYCFAHGAVSYWARLRWLTDFAKALSLLDSEGERQLLAISQQRRTDLSLAASLQLAHIYFPNWVSPQLQHWSEARGQSSGVSGRLARYQAALRTDDPQAHSPLGNAKLSLAANIALFEAPSDRLRLTADAPLTSLLRRVTGLGHRQPRRNNKHASP